LAELGRIDALARADRTEDATNAAIALTETRPEMAEGWIARGDLLRQQDKWAEAISAYDKAIALIDPADADALWFPLYARAIALERQGNFDAAEADLKAALKIRPDNPQVLNYLGYSYVDQRKAGRGAEADPARGRAAPGRWLYPRFAGLGAVSAGPLPRGRGPAGTRRAGDEQ